VRSEFPLGVQVNNSHLLTKDAERIRKCRAGHEQQEKKEGKTFHDPILLNPVDGQKTRGWIIHQTIRFASYLNAGAHVTSPAAPIATGWSDPVPGRVFFFPLWTSAFSRRTITIRL